MSRPEQLGGFPTSGMFGFRQAHTQRPAAAQPDHELPTGRPAHIGVPTITLLRRSRLATADLWSQFFFMCART